MVLFETASTVETKFKLQRRKKTTNLQIEKMRKTKSQEEIVEKENSLWAYLPNDPLVEILLRIFAGDRVTFRSVCRSWYSVSLPSMTTKQQLILPLKGSCSDSFSSPFLICPDKKVYHPIYAKLYSVDYFPDIPGANVRAARDGWLLMNESIDLFFYNPFTKAKITLPDSDAMSYHFLYFSAPPTSTDFLVVAVARMLYNSYGICFMKSIGEGWTYREISPYRESFRCSYCNIVVLKDVYYFLGARAKLIVFERKMIKSA